jgi:hypothetical protein
MDGIDPIHRWLRVGRWLVATLALALVALNIWGVALFPGYIATNLDSPRFTPSLDWTPVQVQNGLAQLGWPATTLGWIVLIRDLLIVGVGGVLAFLVLRQRAAGWFGLLVALVFIMMMGASAPVEVAASRAPVLGRLSATLDAISWQLFFLLFYLFPTGRPVPGWTRWLIIGWAAYIVAQAFGPDAWRMEPNAIISLLFFALVLAAIGSQFYRYIRRSDATQRQQTKLVVFALMTVLMSVFLEAIADALGYRDPNVARLGTSLVVSVTLWMFFGLTFALVPSAIGVAILRYRLWDIDLIIRRTLIYAILTALLGLIYVGSIVVLQALLRPLVGVDTQFATVISTLAIAALFGPLRRRIQQVIDRRFYRRRYDSQTTLQAFSNRLRDETDLERLTDDLQQAVQDTLQPAHVSLWLRDVKPGA